MISLSDIRKEYTLAGLRKKDLHPDPIEQFRQWMKSACDAGVLEPTAMSLATASGKGVPSIRTVLLKGVDQRGFQFFSNYESRKGREMAENRHASLCFHWRELERQICIEGQVSRVEMAESEAYFHSRPLGSQWAAWVSKQSSIVLSREDLENSLESVQRQYVDQVVPLPHYWGGYILAPVRVEFWQGRPSRLHDRLSYSRKGGGWQIDRLCP